MSDTPMPTTVNRIARALMEHNASGETFRDDHEGWPEQAYRAEARVVLAALGADTAWVIEKAESSPSSPSYWAGWGWSINHGDAIRYARKIDAENTRAFAIDETDLGTDPGRHRVCEHSWDVPACETCRDAGTVWAPARSLPRGFMLFAGQAVERSEDRQHIAIVCPSCKGEAIKL